MPISSCECVCFWEPIIVLMYCRCVKDGKVVETGTHLELLSVDGEYAHLYNAQAQAFSSVT